MNKTYANKLGILLTVIVPAAALIVMGADTESKVEDDHAKVGLNHVMSWVQPDNDASGWIVKAYAGTNTAVPALITLPLAQNSVDVAALFNGLPAGIYTVHVAATNAWGNTSGFNKPRVFDWNGKRPSEPDVKVQLTITIP